MRIEIVDPQEESVEQYFLQNGHFKLHLKAAQGRIESRAIPDFSIDIRAIFDENANLGESFRRAWGDSPRCQFLDSGWWLFRPTPNLSQQV